MSHRRTPVTPTSAFNLPRQNEWLTDLGVPPVPGGVRVRVGVKVRVRLGGRARQLGKLELMPSQPGLLRTNTGITVWGAGRLSRVMKTAQRIVRTNLPSLNSTYSSSPRKVFSRPAGFSSRHPAAARQRSQVLR